MATFHHETGPVIARYRCLGRLITVDGNADSDIVFEEIRQQLLALVPEPRQ